MSGNVIQGRHVIKVIGGGGLRQSRGCGYGKRILLRAFGDYGGQGGRGAVQDAFGVLALQDFGDVALLPWVFAGFGGDAHFVQGIGNLFVAPSGLAPIVHLTEPMLFGGVIDEGGSGGQRSARPTFAGGADVVAVGDGAAEFVSAEFMGHGVGDALADKLNLELRKGGDEGDHHFAEGVASVDGGSAQVHDVNGDVHLAEGFHGLHDVDGVAAQSVYLRDDEGDRSSFALRGYGGQGSSGRLRD